MQVGMALDAGQLDGKDGKLLLIPHVGREMQKIESQARRWYTKGPDSAQENLQLLLLKAGSLWLPVPVFTGNHICITALKEVAS